MSMADKNVYNIGFKNVNEWRILVIYITYTRKKQKPTWKRAKRWIVHIVIIEQNK